MPVTVFVDAENVRRSRWPNLSPGELVERAADWAAASGRRAVVVFDGDAPAPRPGVEVVGSGAATADDWIAAAAADLDGPYWLVTSDRGLRARAGDGAERVVGGGAFVAQLTAGS